MVKLFADNAIKPKEPKLPGTGKREHLKDLVRSGSQKLLPAAF
jgi:hypothetical protein